MTAAAPNTDKTSNKRSKTQEKILNAAHELLWQRGYKAMSLNDLVAHCKISKGGLFHYYPNKKAVALAVLEDYFKTHITQRLESFIAKDSDAHTLKQGLLNWLEDTYKLYASKDFHEGCMLGNFALETSDSDEDLRDALKSMMIAWENQLVSYLRPLAQADKLLIEPRQFARLIIALFEGITMTSKVHRDQIRASRDFQTLADLIDRTIKN